MHPGGQDSEELLRNLHLAPYAKPVVSLVDDFPMVQKHKGWQFGYISDNTTRRMTCAPSLRHSGAGAGFCVGSHPDIICCCFPHQGVIAQAALCLSWLEHSLVILEPFTLEASA